MSNRVHPSDAAGSASAAADQPEPHDARPAVYTVWKRSSMGFQGTDGFCVYDAAGSLAFRVDNYSRRRKLCAGELMLMDGHGTPLLALKPQLLSLHDRWNCYTASPEDSLAAEQQLDRPSSSPPQQQQQQVFTMARCSALRTTGDEAEVHMSAPAARAAGYRYRVEGSFSRRSCKILHGGSDGREAARIARKSAGVASSRPVATLGDDVFSLVVSPGVDAATVMAIVVVLDRICHHRPCKPRLCSSQ